MSAPASAAESFRRLHDAGLLILTNVHDAGTARLVASLGAKAIATTSAGVAWVHGYPDGDALPLDLLLATVRDIARVVSLPITVDVEGGLSGDPAAVGDAVERVADAGGVGVNIEDGAADPDLLCAKIEHAKRGAARAGVDVFVNARTDVYLRGFGRAGHRAEESLARAERYRAAGADGFFAPGLVDAGEIRTIAAALKMPLNVLARQNLPPASELEALGVRRLSAGPALAEVAYATMAARAAAYMKTGESAPLLDGAMAYPELNALMTRRE